MNKKRIFKCFFFLILNAVFAESTFKLSAKKDLALGTAGLLLTGSDLVFDIGLKVNWQSFDENQQFDKNNVNAFDRFFMHNYNFTLDRVAGNVLLTGALVTPLSLLASSPKNDWATYGVMYAETLLIANGLKEISKMIVNRYRPMCYFKNGDSYSTYKNSGDFANSFVSGHSTMAFAGAAFTSYVFCKSFPDSSLKYAVCGGSFAFAAATAVVRVLSGNHFVSDVLAGAVLGSAVGILVPWLHTSGTDSGKTNSTGSANCTPSLLMNGFCMRINL